MDINHLDSIHDLILIIGMFSGSLIIIGDNNTPEEKSTFEYVESTLNSLQLSWFRGSQDGRIYVTKDALMYMTCCLI